MENDKSPGIDVLPIEFYKEFFENIKNDLLPDYYQISLSDYLWFLRYCAIYVYFNCLFPWLRGHKF